MPIRFPPLQQFWLPLLAVGIVLTLVHGLGGDHPNPRTIATALLLTGTVALSGYLFAVIIHPEKF